MKKIAIISASYYPNIWSPQGRSTYSLAYGLAQKGHDVSVFTFTSKQETFKEQDGQVMVYHVGGVAEKNVTSLPFTAIGCWNERLLALLLCEKWDTIIVNSWQGYEAARKYDTAKVVSIVPFLYSFTGWLVPLLTFGLEAEIKQREAACIMGSDVVVAHTEKFGQKLMTHTDREVVLISNSYMSFNESSNKVERDKNKICFVGKVNREKSVERILRVLPDLPEATLTIASPDSSSSSAVTKLRSLAKQLDVDHRLDFTGWLSTKDANDVYRRSAVAVVPSQFEPFGYPAIDPMALGTPVLVSEWSLLEEYLADPGMVFSSLNHLQEQLAAILGKDEVHSSIEANKKKTRAELAEPYITSMLESIL